MGGVMADNVEVNFVVTVTKAGLDGSFSYPSASGTASFSYGAASFPRIGLQVTGITRNGGVPEPVSPDKFSAGIKGMYFQSEDRDIHTTAFPEYSFDGTLTPLPPNSSTGICAIQIITRGTDKDLYTITYSGTMRRLDLTEETGHNNHDDGPYGPASTGQFMGQTKASVPGVDSSQWWFNSLSITIAPIE